MPLWQRFAQIVKGFLRQWTRFGDAPAEPEKVGKVGFGKSSQVMRGAQSLFQHPQCFFEMRFRLCVPSAVLHEDGEVAQAHRHIFVPETAGFFPQPQRLPVKPRRLRVSAGALEQVGEVAQAGGDIAMLRAKIFFRIAKDCR